MVQLIYGLLGERSSAVSRGVPKAAELFGGGRDGPTARKEVEK